MPYEKPLPTDAYTPPYYEDVPREAPFLRTEHNYDMAMSSELSGLDCSADAGRTQQQFAEEVDINTIVRRFGLTGTVPENFRMPEFADFSEVVDDYHTAMNLVRQAGEEFLTVPAEIRARFHNDPQELMTFLEDPGNRQEAIKLKLLPEPPAAPDPALEGSVEPLNVMGVAE